jgi:hypothetical protein
MNNRHRNLVVLSLASVLVSHQAQAQEPAKAPARAAEPPAAGAPTPSPELKEFGSWFVGTWKCETKWNASPMGPAHTAKATVPIKWAGGGFWIVTNYKEQKTKDNPMPFDVTEWLGHDGKKFTRSSFDNFGGRDISTGSMEGDKLAFKGEAMMMGGQKSPSGFAFTKKGPKELMFEVSMAGPDGKPMDLGGGNCKK